MLPGPTRLTRAILLALVLRNAHSMHSDSLRSRRARRARGAYPSESEAQAPSEARSVSLFTYLCFDVLVFPWLPGAV